MSPPKIQKSDNLRYIGGRTILIYTFLYVFECEEFFLWSLVYRKLMLPKGCIASAFVRLFWPHLYLGAWCHSKVEVQSKLVEENVMRLK